MKKRVFGIAAAVLVFFSLCVPAFAGGVPGAVSRAAGSVVRLTVNTSFGTERTSGIVIGKGSKAKYVLTGLRSVEGGKILVGTSEEQNISASVIAKDAEKNLAVLELSEELDKAKPVKFTKRELNDSDIVYAVGYYAGEDEANITEGTVISVNDFSADGISARIYRTTAAVTERNSGGMLSDKYGHAAGICYYDGNIDDNKAVTSDEIFAMLDENEIDYKKATFIYLLIIAVVILAAAAFGVYMLLSAIRTKKENSPRIIGVSGDHAGQEIPVTAENISIGRDAKICQIVILSDSKVSRCHCSIRYDAMKRSFILTDLSSTYGTYVNGEKLEPNVPRYISPGTVFGVGTGSTSFKTAEGGADI